MAAGIKTLEHWHRVVKTREMSELAEIIHPDAIFRSPAVYKPYAGRDTMIFILSQVIQVFEDFTYHREFVTADGSSAVLEFSARIGEREIDGADFIRFDSDGLITEFKVMVRPLSSLTTLADAMNAQVGAALSG